MSESENSKGRRGADLFLFLLLLGIVGGCLWFHDIKSLGFFIIGMLLF